jgi:hypothetical protein
MSILSRRNMVVGAAAVPALAVAIPAAAEADPVFAAIERHRQLYAAYAAAVRHKCALEEELPIELCRTTRNRWENKEYDTDDPRWIKAVVADDETFHLAERAADNLADMEPTSLVGVIALLEYFVEAQANGDEVWPEYVYDERLEPVPFSVAIARTVASALSKFAA